MTTIASQITSLTSVYSTVYSDADQRKHQSSASLAFVWGIHRDRWIPRTKGQLRGKCFHLMTSSWYVSVIWVILFSGHGNLKSSALSTFCVDGREGLTWNFIKMIFLMGVYSETLKEWVHFRKKKRTESTSQMRKYHFDEIFTISCTGSCPNDNFRRSPRRKFQNDDISVSLMYNAEGDLIPGQCCHLHPLKPRGLRPVSMTIRH